MRTVTVTGPPGGGGAPGGLGGCDGSGGAAGGLGGGAAQAVSIEWGLITPAPSWPALLGLVLAESMLVAVHFMQLR